MICLWFFVFLCNSVWCQTTVAPSEGTTYGLGILEQDLEQLAEAVTNPTVVLNSLAGQNIAPSDTNKNTNKNYQYLFQKFTNNKLVEALNDKVTKISNFFNHPNSPGYASLQGLQPGALLEKIKKKGSILTGSTASIFGITHGQKPDYPFAYRNARNLGNYTEPVKESLKFGHLKNIMNISNSTYKFPYFGKLPAVKQQDDSVVVESL